MPWLPLLGILLGLDLPPTPETARLDERFLRETLAEVAMRFLVSSLAGTPTMLVVEDVQFIDEASADLLLRLSLAGAGLRRSSLVTHSDPGTTWAPADDETCAACRSRSAPLREADAAEIVRIATDDEPSVTQRSSTRSPADPPATRCSSSSCSTWSAETGTTESLPDSVESVIAGEIDRLSPTDRTVLRYASVLGTSFDPALLATAVHDDVELDAGVWDGSTGSSTRSTGELRFRNTLVRDAAYEGLPYRRRRVLHERVGEAIEALAGSSVEEEVSTLALHFFEARRYDKAWQYCRLAGDRARAVVANVEAARFYRRALAAARRRRDVPPRERAEVWKSLGAVQDSAGRFAEAYEALRHATKLLSDDPAAQAETYENRSRARIRSGEYRRALRETTAGFDSSTG